MTREELSQAMATAITAVVVAAFAMLAPPAFSFPPSMVSRRTATEASPMRPVMSPDDFADEPKSSPSPPSLSPSP